MNSLNTIKINKNYVLVKNKYNLFFLLNTNNNKYIQVNDFNVLELEDILNSEEIETIFKYIKNKIYLKDIEYNLPSYLEYIFTKKEIIKPTLPYRPNKNKLDLINTKSKLEEYYQIKVDKNNKNNKYYFNTENYSYTLLDEFQLGVLLEENFEFLLEDATSVPAVLTDTELHNLFMMFRRVESPNRDCISFCNLTLNTNTFKEVDRVSTFTTKRVKHNYFENLENNEDVTLMEKVLREIFVNKKTGDESLFYDFLQRFGASFLAFNKHKFIYMLTGSGDDGKSIVLSILRLIHGDLAVTLKVRNLIDDFYLINLSDTNVLLLDELNKNSFTKEITAILKDITGRGVINNRVMYSQSTVKIQDYGVPFIATNIVPYVAFNDTAYWSRLHLVRLPNKFVTVDNEEELGDNEYMKDEELEEKLAQDKDGVEWLISASINAYRRCMGHFSVKQSALDTQFIYDGNNPIRLFVERFVVEDRIMSVLSVLEIKYYLLRFCIRNNINRENLGVGSSRELSQEIGYKLKNKFKDVEKGRKEGVVVYKGLSLMIEDNDNYSVEELREKIKLFEDMIF